MKNRLNKEEFVENVKINIDAIREYAKKYIASFNPLDDWWDFQIGDFVIDLHFSVSDETDNLEVFAYPTYETTENYISTDTSVGVQILTAEKYDYLEDDNLIKDIKFSDVFDVFGLALDNSKESMV